MKGLKNALHFIYSKKEKNVLAHIYKKQMNKIKVKNYKKKSLWAQAKIKVSVTSQ